MKNFLAAVIFLLIFAADFSMAAAHELFWCDRNSGFEKFAKIVLYPLTNAWDDFNDYQLGGEGTRNFRFNSYVDDRLTKKLKKVNFIRLANEIHEKEDILTNLYGELLQPFEDEEARAAAVEEATMADMYIVPKFRENRVQKDISPRREWDVELMTWTEESGGPNGYRKYDERKRTVHHVIPETPVYLHILQLEFTGYDKDAEKILTSVHQNRSYGVTEESQFHTLVDEFQKVFLEARGNKIPGKSNKPAVGFTPVAIADGDFSEDIYFSGAMDYALQELAIKRIKNARVVVDDSPVNFYIRSKVNRCELIPRWVEPSYSVSNKILRTEKRKWIDTNDNNKEKEMTIYYYDQYVVDHYAHWVFNWSIGADFWLVTPENEVLVSQSYREFDDKPADAYRHAADDFVKKVNDFLKGKKVSDSGGLFKPMNK